MGQQRYRLRLASLYSSGSSSERWAGSKTVYDIYAPSRRRMLLGLVAAVYPLLPLSDTILLTSMPTIEHDLAASTAAVTATMSLYLVAAGVGFALWGPISDWLGRLFVYHASLVLFSISSVGSALAPSIGLFLLGRSVQGLAAAGSWSVGNAVVADVYPIEIRGVAFGIFMMPGMLGPVIAPFIGAALTQSLGWRSMMWFLAILGGAAQLAVLVIYRETQHHRVARTLAHKCRQQQQPPPDWVLQDSCQTSHPAKLHPKQLLQLLRRLVTDMTVLPYMLLQWHTFGCMFLMLLQLTEVLLETTSLSPTKIGLCYFATGFASMVGSLLGGWAADRAAGAEQAAATARVEWSSLVSLLLIPAGLLLVGWTEAAGWRDGGAIAAALVGGSLVSYASSFVLPGGYSYLSHKAGPFAAAVGSITAAGTNFWPAGLMQANPAAKPTIGLWPYNTIIAAFTTVLAGTCCGVCLWQRRLQAAVPQQQEQEEQAVNADVSVRCDGQPGG